MKRIALPQNRIGTGHAPGKVILLGEHAVVYGWPAIALPLNRGISVEVFSRETASGSCLDPPRSNTPQRIGLEELIRTASRALRCPVARLGVRISSTLPPAMGLGSSAALSVALVRALAAYHRLPLSDTETSNHAYVLECRFHGRPSGIDNTTVAHATLLRFVRGSAPTFLHSRQPLPLLIVLGKQPRATRTMVETLRQRQAHDPRTTEAAFARIGTLVDAATHALHEGDWNSLALCMNENHSILRALGVSTPELDVLVERARRHGAWAAKLTGGGGGGAVVCLCPEERDRVQRRFTEEGWTCWPVDWPPRQGGLHERPATHGLRIA